MHYVLKKRNVQLSMITGENLTGKKIEEIIKIYFNKKQEKLCS